MSNKKARRFVCVNQRAYGVLRGIGGQSPANTIRGADRIRTGDGGFAIRCLSHLATAPITATLKQDRKLDNHTA